VSADNSTLEMMAPGWALGPRLIQGPSSFVLDVAAGHSRDAVWWGLAVVDEAAEAAEGLGGPPAVAPEASPNSHGSPFVVRREGALYAHGRSDRYLYLTGVRDPRVTVRVDTQRRCASFGSARVGWQSLQGKVVRPAVVMMQPAGLVRPRAKYKVIQLRYAYDIRLMGRDHHRHRLSHPLTYTLSLTSMMVVAVVMNAGDRPGLPHRLPAGPAAGAPGAGQPRRARVRGQGQGGHAGEWRE
jgi:hypothetical protein